MIKLNPVYRSQNAQWKTTEKLHKQNRQPVAQVGRAISSDSESNLFEQLQQLLLLSPSQERILARKIFLYRQAFQRIIVKEPNVVQHLIETLSSWEAKKARLDSICNVALSETAKRKILEPAIKSGLVRTRRLLRQLKNSTSHFATRKIHRNTVKLVESMSIRPRVFESSPFRNQKAIELLDQYRALCQQMTKSNLRLVAQVARQICGNSPLLMDMIQEGTLGLMHAVTKFDHQRNMRFSTYATPWIRQHIYAALPNAHRTIRLPESYRYVGKKVNLHINRIQKENELSDDDSGNIVWRVAERMSLSSQDVMKHIRLRRSMGSLDRVVDLASGNLSLGDLILSKRDGPQQIVQERVRHEQTIKAMKHSLNDKEQDVISLRYGLNDGIDRSFAEVGREMGITRERVRQIEKPALEKLSRLQIMTELNDD